MWETGRLRNAIATSMYAATSSETSYEKWKPQRVTISTPTTAISTMSASALRNLQVFSTTPSAMPRSAGRTLPASCIAGASAAQGGADFCERFDYIRAARLGPFVPVGPHRVDRPRDLGRLRLGEHIAGVAERLLRRGLFGPHRVLVPL